MLFTVVVGAKLAATNPVNLTAYPAANIALRENVTYTCSSSEGLIVNWLIDDKLAKTTNSPHVFVDNAAGIESSSILILTAELELNRSIITCFTSSGSATNVTLLIQGKAFHVKI